MFDLVILGLLVVIVVLELVDPVVWPKVKSWFSGV